MREAGMAGKKTDKPLSKNDLSPSTDAIVRRVGSRTPRKVSQSIPEQTPAAPSKQAQAKAAKPSPTPEKKTSATAKAKPSAKAKASEVPPAPKNDAKKAASKESPKTKAPKQAKAAAPAPEPQAQAPAAAKVKPGTKAKASEAAPAPKNDAKKAASKESPKTKAPKQAKAAAPVPESKPKPQASAAKANPSAKAKACKAAPVPEVQPITKPKPQPVSAENQPTRPAEVEVSPVRVNVTPAIPTVAPKSTAPSPSTTTTEQATMPPVMKKVHKAAVHAEQTKLVLMVQQPGRLFAYWELTRQDAEKHGLLERFGAPLLLLRMHDYAYRSQQEGPVGFFDLNLMAGAKEWYIPIGYEERGWKAELGYVSRQGKFCSICQSNWLTCAGWRTAQQPPLPPAPAVKAKPKAKPPKQYPQIIPLQAALAPEAQTPGTPADGAVPQEMPLARTMDISAQAHWPGQEPLPLVPLEPVVHLWPDASSWHTQHEPLPSAQILPAAQHQKPEDNGQDYYVEVAPPPLPCAATTPWPTPAQQLEPLQSQPVAFWAPVGGSSEMQLISQVPAFPPGAPWGPLQPPAGASEQAMAPPPPLQEMAMPASLPPAAQATPADAWVQAPEEHCPFEIRTDALIYGKTEPGSLLIVNDKVVRIAADGTFAVRCSLLEGRQTLSVQAVNSRGEIRDLSSTIEKKLKMSVRGLVLTL